MNNKRNKKMFTLRIYLNRSSFKYEIKDERKCRLKCVVSMHSCFK